MAKRILFVFTSNDRLVNTSVKTGWYLPEAAHPYYGLVEKGVTVDFVSEMGGRPPLDPQSIPIAEDDPVSKKVRPSVSIASHHDHRLICPAGSFSKTTRSRAN